MENKVQCPECGSEFEPKTSRQHLCKNCAKYFGEKISKAKYLSIWHKHEPAQEMYGRLLAEASSLILVLGIAEAMVRDKYCFCGLSPRQLSLRMD